MPINWSECCICQLRIKESLRSTAQGHEALAKILPLFAELNELGFDISRLDTTGLTLQESLEQNHAVYHHPCRTKYNQQTLDRAKQRAKKGQSLKHHLNLIIPVKDSVKMMIVQVMGFSVVFVGRKIVNPIYVLLGQCMQVHQKQILSML